MTETDALAVLHVSRDASPEEIRRAYLDLVKVWHPDRFQSDARLRGKAQQTLQQINQAYALLEHGATAPRPGPTGRTDPAHAPQTAAAAPVAADDTRWHNLHPHTVIAACAGLALGIALAVTFILRSAPEAAADPATEPPLPPSASPSEAPSPPVPSAQATRPRAPAEPPRPESGTDIRRQGAIGRGVLSIRSGLALDAVVDLAHEGGDTRRLYLRRGEKVTLLDLVPGPYRLRVAVGTTWTGRWFAHTFATLEREQQVTAVQSAPGASFEAVTLLPGDASLRSTPAFGPD